MKQQEFIGLIYDGIEEIVILESPIIRGTFAEALADAKQLISVVNAEAEIADDSAEGNTTVGRVDDSYVYVRGPNGVENEDDVADREFDEHADREELRAMGRLPGQDDTPSLPGLPAY